MPPWTGAFALDVLASAVALFVSALPLVSCNPLKKSFCFFVFFFANAVLFFLRRPVFFLLGCAGDCKAVISLIYVCPWLFPPCGVQGRSPRFKVFWPCRKAQAFRASSAPRPARRDWRFLAKTRCFYAPSFYIG
ncbi:MAG: hypothetical protein DM484_29520 [Candidatus Methylumidiphilus alinenensis]|uniref:Uncharacterized protein n=1 Tax=Candidatus Methylumidiphilus alinenensis TaxID=2202197 RepID=A0A2W4S6R1_9GAMM|nr:MAG: hypothetical protein DM484_29520 [Candidatus Methylumidiphilus alinenensis]